VNELYFINNSSVGLYADIVKIRREKAISGFEKILALFPAVLSAFRSYHPITVEFKSQNRTVSKAVSFVFVGNNKYEYSGMRIGERKRLNEGILTLCVVNKVGKMRLLALSIKMLAGRAIHDKDFNVLGLQKFTLTPAARSIDVARDGEMSKIDAPLVYQILPGALSVITP
jgi:diacylglycerol kinase family enzyme